MAYPVVAEPSCAPGLPRTLQREVASTPSRWRVSPNQSTPVSRQHTNLGRVWLLEAMLLVGTTLALILTGKERRLILSVSMVHSPNLSDVCPGFSTGYLIDIDDLKKSFPNVPRVPTVPF